MIEKITMIGTLPPLKTNVYYCVPLAESVSKKIKVDFISFKKIYPNFLYPGKRTTDEDKNFRIKDNNNLKIRRLITYYNPFSWVLAGILPKTKVIHSQWWNIYISIFLIPIHSILKLRGKKIVLTVHNVLPHEKSIFDRIISKIIFFLSDYFLVHSENNKKQLNKIYKIPLDKIRVIPMGLHDTVLTDKTLTKEKARSKLNLDKNSKVILQFGSIRPYKGLDDTIRAISIANKKIKNIILLVAGEPWKDWKDYQKLIYELNVKDNIKLYLNYIPMSEVQYFYRASDIVVVPYNEFESQSGPGNIALSCFKPLIVSNVGGLPDLVRDKKAIIKPRDYKDLADKIIKIFNNKKLYNKLSKDSEYLAKKYSWENVSKDIIKTYNLVETNA